MSNQQVEGWCLNRDPEDGSPEISPCEAIRQSDTLFVSGGNYYSFGYDFFFHEYPARLQFHKWIQDYYDGLLGRLKDAQEEVTKSAKRLERLKESGNE